MKLGIRGFTLVELLVAGAIMMVLMGALLALFSSSRRGYQTVESTSLAAGALQSTVQTLRYDLSLTGFRGLDQGAVEDRTFSEPALEVAMGKDGTSIDGLTVRYWETRFTGGKEQSRVVRYLLEDGQLLRGEDGATPVALLGGVLAFELVGYRSRSAPAALHHNAPKAEDLAAIELRLELSQGTGSTSERFAVAIPNRP